MRSTNTGNSGQGLVFQALSPYKERMKGIALCLSALFALLYGITVASAQTIGPIAVSATQKKSTFVPASSVLIASRDADTTSSSFRGDQVLISTGNKIEQENDFATSGESPLYLTRTYNHYWGGVGLFGKYWISNLDYKLTFGTTAINACYPRPGGGQCSIGANTVVYAWRPDGRTIKYTKNASDGIFYEDKPSAVSTIVVQGDGSFVLYGENNEYEAYTSAGYPSVIGNGAGINWAFTYTSNTYLNRVTHTSGRYVEFVWTNGQLTSVRDPAGNYHGYAYTANAFGTGLHRLASNARPGTPIKTTVYLYELAADISALTGKLLDGVRYSKFTYDVSGRATGSEHNGLDKYSFVYTSGANGLLTVTETNPLGKQITYQFQNGKPTTTTRQPSTYAPGTAYALIEYDANGYPTMKSDFNGNNTAFSYNAKGQLTQKIEAFGTPLARTTQYVWDTTKNRILSETILGVSLTQYSYGAGNRLWRTAVTNLSPYGVANQVRETFYSFTDYGGTLPNGVHVMGMLASVTTDGPLAGTGDAVTSHYDTLGNLTYVENSLGHRTTYSAHNGLGQPGRVAGVNGDITDYTYDAGGRVTRVRTYPDGSTAADTLYAYNGSGLLDSITAPDGQIRRYQYDAAHRVTTEFEPEAGGTYAQKEYVYNAASLPTSITVGRSTTMPGSSIVGNIDGVTMVSGVGMRIRGWACSTYMNSSINVHLYLGGSAGSGTYIGAYTANLASESAVASACQAQGTAYRFEIPVTLAMRQQYGDEPIYIHGISPVGASNLLINGSGNFYIPPPAGGGGGGCNPICPIAPSIAGGSVAVAGTTMSATSANSTDTYKTHTDYDELGRVRGRRGNNGQDIKYTYDLNGNIKTVTDSSNRVTTLGYDAMNRMVSSTDPLNQTTWFEYNGADQVTKVTDPRGKITTYVYDGFGQLWAHYNPDSGATTFQYDASGLRTYMTRNDGSALAYQYDALGRLTWYGTSTEGRAYGYDWCGNGKGRLCNADYIGGTRHYGYSPYGRVTITRDWTPNSDEWTGYSYDSLGRLAGISYPSGVSVGYGFSQGKMTVMQATINGVTQNVVTGLQYQPFGPMNQLTYGNGVIKERSYDLDGRMTVTHDHGWVGHTQHYNVNDEITAIDNWSRTTYNQQFTYDALSRLTGIASPSGNQTLAYDANGNRTQYDWYPGIPETYQIDPNSNRILSTHVNYGYDNRGNRANQSWGGSTATYAYDAFNRLKSASRDVASSYTNPDYVTATYPAGTTTYTINGLDQRVGKSGPLGSSRFVYAGQNQILTEYTNAVWTSYLWLGNEPIAMVRNNQLFFIHGDHLGRPEVVTDSNNSWRWIAANYAFGRAVLGENNSIGGLNLGLPGQYYDAETGFWYNGMRDYDGRTGGYLQSDPIGLAGGLNTYSYVSGNPVSYVDPLGLQEMPDDTDHMWRLSDNNCSFMIDCLERYERLGIEGECTKTPFTRGLNKPICYLIKVQTCSSITHDWCSGKALPPLVVPNIQPISPTPQDVSSEEEAPVGHVEVGPVETIELGGGGGHSGGGGFIGGGGGGPIGTVTVGEVSNPDKEEEEE